MNFIVAVDGPAGAGKGTITKNVADRLGLITIDTGAMYRCVTLYMLNNKIALEDNLKINDMLEKIRIELENVDGIQKVFLNGKDVSEEIRTEKVNNIVSQVSHLIPIREKMVDLQRKMAVGKKVIMEGRDIGTNVFPSAEVKIYLDATPEERARRRYVQNTEKGIECTYEEILENVKFRDNNDKTNKVAPLKQAEDAIYIDSSNMTIEEVTDKVVEIISQKKLK